MPYEYFFKPTRVIDGDTVDGFIDLGFSVHRKIRVRLGGIDAPETRTRDKKEKVFGFPKDAVTLKDQFGGSYYLTSDGIHIKDKKLFLIEFKHSKSGIPTFEDVGDALFKYHFFKEIANIQDKNSKKFETKLVIVASSGKKSTSELEHNPTLIKIKEECDRNSILLICIGKGDGPAQILRQLNSIKD